MMRAYFAHSLTGNVSLSLQVMKPVSEFERTPR